MLHEVPVSGTVVIPLLAQKSHTSQLSNVLMQGHCNGCFGYVSENLVSIQKSFSKLTALPQAWHKTIFKLIPNKLAELDKAKLTS